MFQFHCVSWWIRRCWSYAELVQVLWWGTLCQHKSRVDRFTYKINITFRNHRHGIYSLQKSWSLQQWLYCHLWQLYHFVIEFCSLWDWFPTEKFIEVGTTILTDSATVVGPCLKHVDTENWDKINVDWPSVYSCLLHQNEREAALLEMSAYEQKHKELQVCCVTGGKKPIIIASIYRAPCFWDVLHSCIWQPSW